MREPIPDPSGATRTAPRPPAPRYPSSFSGVPLPPLAQRSSSRSSRLDPPHATGTAARRSTRPPAPRTPPSSPTRAHFRPELEGLRALAAALVVIYHVWVGRVSGGVDVFFVISGFLWVGGLARAAARGPIEVGRHWARTLRRLVPTTMVVLSASALAGAFLLPELRWAQTIREVVASALFLQNWRLAADSADYYAAHDQASIVQHLWSISVQVQVALVLPVLVAALVVLARVLRRDLRPMLLGALLLLTTASLVYSVVLTADDQQLAYFHSAARLWEFTAGGLLALLLDRVRLGRPTRVALGWSGVVALCACGVVLDVAGGFPGYLALWPVLAACAVLTAGRTGSPFGVDRVLASRPMRRLGGLGFALYLWHWPVLTLGLVLTRRQEFGALGGVVVVAISLALAVLTHHGVEQPVMRAPIGRFNPRGERRFVAVTLVPVLLIAMAWYSVSALMSHSSPSVADTDRAGAAALAAPAAVPARTGPAPVVPAPRPLYDPSQPLLPSPTALGDDWAKTTDCAPGRSHDDLEVCHGAGTRGLRVLVIGDSHMQQFLPALEDGAAAGRWQVSTILEGACPLAVGSATNPGDDACAAHNADALDEIKATRPDVVVLEASRNVRPGRTEETPPEFVAMWQRIATLGIRMVAVRDNPRFESSPSTCFLETPGPSCSAARADVYGPAPYLRVAAPPQVRFLDLADAYCTADQCPPVIGNVLVHLDDNHISATYSRTLGPVVTRKMEPLLDR